VTAKRKFEGADLERERLGERSMGSLRTQKGNRRLVRSREGKDVNVLLTMVFASPS